jgi:glycosyltransferase involved in cell wall biosynthesis
MKICHLSTVHQPNDVRIFKKECISLSNAGHDISFVVPHEKSEVQQSIEIISIPSSMSKASRLLVQPFRLLMKALSVKPDVFHFHDFELWPIGLILRVLGYKVIADVHEDVPAQLRQREWVPKLIKPSLSFISSLIENNFSRFMTGVIVADTTLAKRFSKYNRNVVTICNYPILYPLPEAKSNNGTFRVLSVGGVFNERCADLVIGASRHLSDVSFLIGGGVGGQYSDLSWQSENCHYLGKLSFEEVQQEYSQADVIVVMFSDDPNHQDIKSNRFFESMYAKKPVLVSALPQWKEFIRKYQCGVAVSLDSSMDLANAITHLKENPSLCEAMSENGQKAVLKAYSWTSEEAKLIKFYRELQ